MRSCTDHGNLKAYWAYRYTPDEDDDNPRDCYHRWARINAFFAHRSMRYEDSSGLLMYGVSVIRTALEQEPWVRPPSPLPDDKRRREYEIAILDVSVLCPFSREENC
jgi:hypothetical protein